MAHKLTRIFVTGAAGYLGSAIAARLARPGHDVFGLTRSAEHAAALRGVGITPVLGDVAKPETYLGILKNCDVAVHALHDAASVAASDQQAIESYRHAARDGRVRRLLYTSGVWVHGDTGGHVVNEQAPLNPLKHVEWRAAHEEAALDLYHDEVKVTVFRGTIVYGESRGMIGAMFQEAREKKTVTLAGDGSQHWSLVHRDDLAEAYHLALEHARGGERYLLCDESQYTLREIGEAIARVTGATLQTTDVATVMAQFGEYGEALLASTKVTAAAVRRELGWVPRHTSFVNEVEALHREWQAQKTPVG